MHSSLLQSVARWVREVNCNFIQHYAETLCYVRPSAQFTGVGKALLAAMEDQAARAGPEALRLESTRTARKFYLRNGFKPEGPPVEAFGMEALPMRKLLTPRA